MNAVGSVLHYLTCWHQYPQVVKKYYEEKIDGLLPWRGCPPTPPHRGRPRERGRGHAPSLHERYILSEYGVDKQLLEQLVDSRLLRSEPFLRGAAATLRTVARLA
ncbi:MAG: hypothetical protein U5L02_05260 [Rheinheimera sp.]|nr:hypothetical protein [Rheinheimera sp.]